MKSLKILLATQNKHKIAEIQAILPEITFTIPEKCLDIPEGSVSYIENALLKATRWQKEYPNHYILADDSGLEVEVLGNAPGVISAEWAGKDATNQEHIDKVMTALENEPNRKAKFVAYIVLLAPTNSSIGEPISNIFFSRGESLGRIAPTQSRAEGFGYDPIFLAQELDYTCTLADLSSEQKNSISHRYHALIGIRDYLLYLIGNKNG